MVGLALQYGRGILVRSWLHFPVLAFLLATIAATILAVDPLLALYGAHERMTGLGTIADGILLYVGIVLLVRTRTEAVAVAVSFFAGSMVVLGYEFVQFIGMDPFTWAVDETIRPFSTIGQTTNLAEYLTVVAVGAAALGLFQGALPPSARVLLILYSAIAVAGTVVTQTRSAVIGIVAGGALLLVLTWTAHPDRRARVLSIAGAAGAAALFAIVLFLTPLGARLLSTVEAPVAAEGDSGLRLEAAADVRVAIYRIALEMFRDRPILGYGPDNFLAALPQYRSDTEPFDVQDTPTSSAHSWVAQVAVTTGGIGLAAFVAIAAVALILTLRSGFRPDAWAGLAMLVAFLGAGLTTVQAIATDWLFWAAAGVVAMATSEQPSAPATVITTPTARSSVARRAHAAVPRTGNGARSAAAWACAGVGLVIALTTVSAMDASLSTRASQLARLESRRQLAMDLGLRATRSDPLRPQYWDTLGLAYVSADRLSDAVAALDRAHKLAPYDVRYDGDLARALISLAQRGDGASAARAREVAERVVRTDPNNPRAFQTRALVMQVIGNLPDALRSSERALALDRLDPLGRTPNADMYVTGIQVLAALGRPKDAIALARTGIPKMSDLPHQLPLRIELSRALAANGQLAEALMEIDVTVAIWPESQSAQQLRQQIVAALGS
jgi:O-antigen ligase